MFSYQSTPSAFVILFTDCFLRTDFLTINHSLGILRVFSRELILLFSPMIDC